MNIPTGIEAEVCADIAERQAKGIAKYGVSVADNPLTLREWLQHAYEETLDQAVYLKRAMTELQRSGEPAGQKVEPTFQRGEHICTDPKCKVSVTHYPGEHPKCVRNGSPAGQEVEG